jgi:hypothetical protein
MNWKVKDGIDIGASVLVGGIEFALLKHVQNKFGRVLLWTGIVGNAIGLGIALWRTSGDLLVNATPGGV